MQAYDELKNKRLSGGDDFRVHLTGTGGVITQASIEDKEDGIYVVSYTCTAAGAHDLHILIGKHNIICLSLISSVLLQSLHALLAEGLQNAPRLTSLFVLKAES